MRAASGRLRFGGALLSLGAVLVCASAGAAPTTASVPSFWVTDGPVNATALTASTLYIPSTTLTCASGVCTGTPTATGAAASDTVKVQDGAATGRSNAFQLIGPVSYFKVSISPASGKACSAFALGVIAFDAASDPIPNYSASLTATDTAGGVSGAVALTWKLGQGTGTVTPKKVSAKDTLTVSNGAGATGASSPFAVTSGSGC